LTEWGVSRVTFSTPSSAAEWLNYGVELLPKDPDRIAVRIRIAAGSLPVRVSSSLDALKSGNYEELEGGDQYFDDSDADYPVWVNGSKAGATFTLVVMVKCREGKSGGV